MVKLAHERVRIHSMLVPSLWPEAHGPGTGRGLLVWNFPGAPRKDYLSLAGALADLQGMTSYAQASGD